GFRIAVLAVRTDSTELGAVKTELEIATLSSLPDSIVAMDSTGGASYRLKVPQEIHSLVLHHSGSPEPLRPEDDPIEKLRKLQDWSASDRNWWDVPYHLLLDLEGRVYEGRDYRYAGDTNTRYDPGGYLIVSVLGNYDLQEPTDAQIEALSRVFAWAMNEFGVPEDRIFGHSDVAETDCPGEGLRRPLKDGTLFAGAREIEPTSGPGREP
ncbi:MAG: peptidoglycan recognition family protein, partial [Rhodothermia bacterium]